MSDLGQWRERFREQVEGFALHVVEQLVLVLIIEVDGGGAVLDLFGDGADGSPLVAHLHEHLERRVEDLAAHLLFLTFFPFGDAHGCFG